MTYTSDPAHVPADKVRLYVGDTNNTKLDLSDEEVAFFLADNNGNALRAAAAAAEALAAKCSGEAEDKTVGPLRLANRRQSKSDRYMRLAKLLWSRALSEKGTPPFAGGISETDKIIRVEDGDRVGPAFGRRMMEYPGGNSAQAATDRDLRP